MMFMTRQRTSTVHASQRFFLKLRVTLGFLLAAALLGFAGHSQAHEFKFADLVIEHPYATPSLAGVRNGSAYLRRIRNQGSQTDRLLGASTAAAERVELHHMGLDGHVMRMREVTLIELPAHGEVSLRHGGSYHLMLVGLKQPLKEGDRFDLTLKFERAGSQTVRVHVQKPREGSASPHRH